MTAHHCSAVLFDLDGVLTDTASVHERAWARLFTAVFEATPRVVDPYTAADYFTHIDGKPRNEGVRSVLESRAIVMDERQIDELGNRKNTMFLAELDAHGARVFPGAVELLDWLESHAIPKAVVSSSRNAEPVLRVAGLRHKIDVVVDGLVALDRGIAGKPAPDTYLYAARQLAVEPTDAIVVEDAASGVESGRRGGFSVIGVDRGAGRETLLRHGASAVVTDLDHVAALCSTGLRAQPN